MGCPRNTRIGTPRWQCTRTAIAEAVLNRPDSRAVEMARLEGVEPPARGFEGRCSIQLSYRRVSLRILSRRHFFWRRSCAGPSARVRFSAVLTSDTWEKACGKFP